MVRASIPNNVNLDMASPSGRFLDHYQDQFRLWWDDVVPSEFRQVPMYLRCPVGCDRAGWADFRFVKPGEYRWGLFQTPMTERQIRFGDRAGESVWQTVPEEHRDLLLKHIRVQADAEPGSVEQSANLARCAPSNYDLRNLYQFLLEEGRHLWAMVHVLVEHFGHAGEDEGQALLQRSCGSDSDPRLLDAFNHSIDEWLSYFIWCVLADRDGKYQLSTVSHGAFDPLARTAAFMLFEEPFHLSIGTQGIERVLRRSAELMQQHDCEDIFPHGGIPIHVIQKYLNYWSPRVLDLFGNDESRRAREAFEAGIRARPYEPSCNDRDGKTEHVLVDRREGDVLKAAQVLEVDALNTAMRRRFIDEVQVVMRRWNRILEEHHIDTRLYLAHERFNRRIGPAKGLDFDPQGQAISAETAQQQQNHWLPTDTDRRQLKSLMQQEIRPDHYAGWIAAPTVSINNKPLSGFAYVKTAEAKPADAEHNASNEVPHA